MDQPDIFAYIPQRPPFVMVDELLRADEQMSQTSFTIREGHLFVENGVFTEPGLVENMAQTAAAGTGFKAAQKEEPAPVGFIGALKGLNIKELPKVGDTITTDISFLHQVMNAHVVMGRIFCGKREIASCEFKIFIQT